MNLKKINKYEIIKHFSLLFLYFCFSMATASGFSPFLTAFYFSCVYVGINEKEASIFVLISSLLLNPTLENLWTIVTSIFVCLLMFYVHKVCKKKIKVIALFAFFLLSLSTYVYYNIDNLKHCVGYLLIGLVALYVFIVTLQVLFVKKNCFKLTLDEAICVMSSISLLGLGLANLNISGFLLYRLALAIIVFMSIAIGTPSLTYCLVISFSFGVALSTANMFTIAEFSILAMFAGMFPSFNKYKIFLITNMAELFIQFYFFGFSIEFVSYLPILIGGVIFLITPKMWLNRLSDFVYVKKSEMTSRSLISTTRKSLKRRVSNLSNVFLDMQQIHLSMVKKQLSKEQLSEMLIREISKNNCKDCLDKSRCMRSIGIDTKSSMQILVDSAVTKGKITMLDIPSAIANRCSNINHLVNLLNRLTDEYKQYRNMVSDVNNVKILLADQMGAVSKLLIDLGEEIDTNVRFDIARENKIIYKLLSINIQCKEVLIYTEKNDELSAVIVAKYKNEKASIEKIVSDVLKCPMQIEQISPVDETEYSSIVLTKIGKYDCIFGLASMNKTGNDTNGDCHSVLRLNKNRFLLALSDGMGTGEKANKISSMTLGLIENFYKAGFENSVIVESVNKLLAVSNQENYSTLDICLLDLDSEHADFIKIGAPIGCVKKESSVEIIDSGSLPIGSLDMIKPITKSIALTTKDLIIMFTDGIVDAFKTEELLIDYISCLACNNPQVVADNILKEAVRLNEMSAKDDMTVLVARTYLKSKNGIK